MRYLVVDGPRRCLAAECLTTADLVALLATKGLNEGCPQHRLCIVSARISEQVVSRTFCRERRPSWGVIGALQQEFLGNDEQCPDTPFPRQFLPGLAVSVNA